MSATKASAQAPVRVLCATNHAYAMPLCVTLVSLVVNQPRERALEIYVMDSGMTAEDRTAMVDSIRANRPDFPLENLHWLVPDMGAVQTLPRGDYVTVEAYLRLLAPEMLPPEIERVLYLDCDVVVRTDVSPLFDAPGDSALWAARDINVGVVSDTWGVFNYAEMGLAADAPYFNSGVMVMNLRRWREEKIGARVLEYLHRHRGSVLIEDQGGLNAVLGGAWTEIDPAWNQMKSVLNPELWERNGFSREDWRRTLREPRIVHFAGKFKPWQTDRQMLPPLRSAYFYEYLQKTVYRGRMRAPWLERLMGPWGYYLLWQEVRPRLRRWAGRGDSASEQG